MTDDELWAWREQQLDKAERARGFVERERAAVAGSHRKPSPETIAAKRGTRTPRGERVPHEVQCPTCGETRTVRDPRPGQECRSCAGKHNVPSRGQISIVPCVTCGCPTRPGRHPVSAAPGTAIRKAGGACSRCYYRANHPNTRQLIDRDDVVARYRAGASGKSIARDLRVSNAAIFLILKAAGLTTAPGQTAATVAARLTAAGVTHRDVRVWARASGHVVGDRGYLPEHLVTAYLETRGAA